MDKRYYTLSDYFKKKYNKKIYKVSIDAGFSCPGRCTYCSSWGSLAPYQRNLRVLFFNDISKRKEYLKKQIQKGVDYYSQKGIDTLFLYFQAFSNTFDKPEILYEIYSYSLSLFDFKGFIVGTRPDLINNDVIQVLNKFKNKYEIWVELGLQSTFNKTLKIIKRGHTYEKFVESVYFLKDNGFYVGTHLIEGLPFETKKQMIESVIKISKLPIDGIKFHYLYIMKNTEILKLYEKGGVKLFNEYEYVSHLCDLISYLRDDIVIFRLFSDPEPDTIAPIFKNKKSTLLNLLNKQLMQNDLYQGKYCKKI